MTGTFRDLSAFYTAFQPVSFTLRSHEESRQVSIKSGDRIATGIQQSRRKLTEAEAQAGGLPEPFTASEWRNAHAGSLQAYADAMRCTNNHMIVFGTIR